MKAILFDLFGTLVDNMTNAQVADFRRRTSEALCVPEDEYARGWAATFTQRAKGEFGSVEAAIRAAAERCATPYNRDGLRAALEVRRYWMGVWMTPRKDACSTILAFRERGYKIGLLSNCSEDVPEMWNTTPFADIIDEPLFSCSEGLRKPMPEFYQRAMTKLGVEAANCVYIADGDNGELAVATQLGMPTIMIRPSDCVDDFRTHAEDNWEGPRVESLSELLDIFE
jgi:putative hydrolase of the HAD superfamily